MFKSIYSKWRARKKRKFEEMPIWVIAFLALYGLLESGFYGYVLKKIMPDYCDVAFNTPLNQWGWQGWMLTAILAGIGFMAWYHTLLVRKCNDILYKHLF